MLNQQRLFYDLGLPLSPEQNKSQTSNNFQNQPYQQEDQEFSLGSFIAEEKPKPNKSLLELTITIREGVKDSIHVYAGDDANQLAHNFTLKHNLSAEAIEIISETIRVHVQNLGTGGNNSLMENKRLIDGKENQNSQSSSMNNIFSRLHLEAQQKKSRQSQREMKHHNESKQSNMVDKRILSDPNHQYLQAMRQKEEKSRRMQLMRDDIEVEKQRSLSFKPSIKVENKKRNDKAEDNLIKLGVQTRSNKNAAEYLQSKNEQQRYSFRPEINKMFSERIVHEKKSSKSTHQDKNQQLYLMSQELKNKKLEKINQRTFDDCTFQPKLNPKMQDREFIPFLERVDYEQRKRSEKFKHGEAQLNYDAKSGRKFYKPQICRPPKKDRNHQDLPIGQYLFNQQKTCTTPVVREDYEPPIQSKSLERSTVLIQNKRRKCLEDYFELMDDDGDGFISADKINLNNLPTDALEIFTPIFHQLESLGVQMNLDTWMDHCYRHLAQLSVAEKNLLFQRQKTEGPTYEQFKPLINLKSQRIANQSRSYSGHVGLYEHCQKQQITKDRKNQQLKHNQLDQERRNCTFKPKIIKLQFDD